MLLVALNAQYVHTSLAVRTLHAFCVGEFEVRILEATINDAFHLILDRIVRSNEQIIGFSCNIWNIELALKLARAVKLILPGSTILCGGPEVSFDSADLLAMHDCIDFVIRGEGEVPLLALLRVLQADSDLHAVPSLAWRNGNEVVLNRLAAPIPLDDIPFAYSNTEIISKPRIAYYESSRGCPFNCGYCLSANYPLRYLSLERTLNELKYFAYSGFHQVKLVDRTFNADPGRANEIWRFLSALDTSTNFHFEICANLLNDESLRIIRGAPKGRFQFEIGIQSTNPETLHAIGRVQDFEQISPTIEALIDLRNAHIHLDLIAGLPFETRPQFKNSYASVFALRPDMLQIGFLKLLKGSRLRDNAKDFGGVWAEYPPYEILQTAHMSHGDLTTIKYVQTGQDAYYHSKRASHAIEYLLRRESAFDLFAQLGELIYGQRLSAANYLRAVLDCYAEHAVRELLLLDWLVNEHSSAPPFLSAVKLITHGRRLEQEFQCDIIRLMKTGEYHPIASTLVIEYRGKDFYILN